MSETMNSGRDKPASEVDAEAPRLREERDEVWVLQLMELRRKITEGIGEADRGELADGETFVARLLGGIGRKAGERRR